MQPLDKRTYWQQHVDACRSSGLTQAEYARRAGVTVKRLGYWIRRDQHSQLSEAPGQVTHATVSALVPVVVNPASLSGELLLQGFVWTLSLPSSVPAAWLVSLLKGLS